MWKALENCGNLCLEKRYQCRKLTVSSQKNLSISWKFFGFERLLNSGKFYYLFKRDYYVSFQDDEHKITHSPIILIPYPDSDNYPKINLDSIPLELKLSPITILEPAPSETMKELLTTAKPEASYSDNTGYINKVHHMLSQNNVSFSPTDTLIKQENSILVNKNGSISPKFREPIREEQSDSALHDDRVTTIYYDIFDNMFERMFYYNYTWKRDYHTRYHMSLKWFVSFKDVIS